MKKQNLFWLALAGVYFSDSRVAQRVNSLPLVKCDQGIGKSLREGSIRPQSSSLKSGAFVSKKAPLSNEKNSLKTTESSKSSKDACVGSKHKKISSKELKLLNSEQAISRARAEMTLAGTYFQAQTQLASYQPNAEDVRILKEAKPAYQLAKLNSLPSQQDKDLISIYEKKKSAVKAQKKAFRKVINLHIKNNSAVKKNLTGLAKSIDKNSSELNQVKSFIKKLDSQIKNLKAISKGQPPINKSNNNACEINSPLVRINSNMPQKSSLKAPVRATTRANTAPVRANTTRVNTKTNANQVPVNTAKKVPVRVNTARATNAKTNANQAPINMTKKVPVRANTAKKAPIKK